MEYYGSGALYMSKDTSAFYSIWISGTKIIDHDKQKATMIMIAMYIMQNAEAAKEVKLLVCEQQDRLCVNN